MDLTELLLGLVQFTPGSVMSACGNMVTPWLTVLDSEVQCLVQHL